MYQGKTCVAIIPARGGSKGIPRKNIKEIAGKPLIWYSINSALKSAYIDKVVVTTDDEEIRRVAIECGAQAPFLRPAELAIDRARSLPVVQHAVKWMQDNEGKSFNYVMLLHPTSPFKTSEDLDECIRIAVEKDADSVISMYALSNFSIAKLKRITDEGFIVPFLPEYPEGNDPIPRHELPTMYKRNAAIFLTKKSTA